MDVKDQLVQTLQLAVGEKSNEYAPIIENTIGWAWGAIAEEHDWWFLRQAKPLPVVIPANSREVTLTSNMVGRMLFMADENGVPVASYLDWAEFNYYAATALREDSVDNPTLFTVRGLVEGKKRLQFNYKPSAAYTCYLHYAEPGTLDNIERVPAAGLITILHLAKSLLTPPTEAQKNKWEAVNYKEYEMYLASLAAWRGQSQPVMINKHLPELDPDTENRLKEIEEW